MGSLWSHPSSSCYTPWGRKLPGQDLFTRQPVSLNFPGTLSLHICKIWLKQAEMMTSSWVRAGGAEMTVQTYTNTLLSINARTGLHKGVLQCIQAQCTVINQILLDLAQNKWVCCCSAVYMSAFCVWWQLLYTNWQTAQFTFFGLFILSWYWASIPSSVKTAWLILSTLCRENGISIVVSTNLLLLFSHWHSK